MPVSSPGSPSRWDRRPGGCGSGGPRFRRRRLFPANCGNMELMAAMGTHDEHGSGEQLGRKRAHVLALLQDAGAPLTASDVAARLGIHPNTARFHLDALETDGLVVRTPSNAPCPGDHARCSPPRTTHLWSRNAATNCWPRC